MNPNANKLWKGPQWALSILLALLGMLGPFSIDTYIPAFSGIAAALNASPTEMQQTLSAYLFGYAFMCLFHGAISDSLGRRVVVLWGLAAFTLASAGCALSGTIEQLIFFRILQGLSTGAGIVVSRAVVRDMFAPSQAQKVMSQITLFFGLAPAVAPLIGGWLFVQFNWQTVFWLLFAIGGCLFVGNYKFLPETLNAGDRQPLNVKNLMNGYWTLGSDPRFALLALASGIPFNGMFLYIMSAPVFLGVHLGLEPQQFFWLFVLTISGIMVGAWFSGRLAGKMTPNRQIRLGFVVMLTISIVNVAVNSLVSPNAWWAMLPIAIYSTGWALMMPVITLLVLDLYPSRRGMASSLQAFVMALVNGVVAGVVAPFVMYRYISLSLASLLILLLGLLCWVILRTRCPNLGGQG